MNDMNDLTTMVKEFNEKLVPIHPTFPTAMTPTERGIRYGYMKEKLNEFLLAGDLVAQVTALAGLIYFAVAALVNQGVQPGRIYAMIHAANMRKFTDEKVLKAKHWHGPEAAIEAELNRQMPAAAPGQGGTTDVEVAF